MSNIGLVLNAVLSPASQVESLQRELYRLNQEIARLEEELKEARQEASFLRRETASKTRGVQELRTVLTPLYQGLQHIFGHIEEMGPGEPAGPAATSSRTSAAWESWKQKMGANSAAAKIIDILMVHGKLNNTQIRIHLGTSRMQTVYDAISKLNKASLLNKNGDEFSLKEL